MANGTSYGIWDDCSDRSLIHRVAIKDNAIDIAQRSIDAIKLKLQSSVDNAKQSNVDISEYIEELQEIVTSEENVRQELRQHQILVGVAGVSGAGKSSAINAWLDFPDLLPSSFEQAATAAVCLISWNYDEREGYQFKAEVDFHSTQDIRKEVDDFFAALQERHQIGDPDDESAASAAESIRELEAHFKSLSQKIKAIWGYKQDDLEKMTAESLWRSRPEVTRLLGTTEYLQSDDPDALLKAVSPFLDSKRRYHGDGGAFAAWPLVKCVRIFLRSEILEHGLTLVDLPGLSDANSARAQIARDFFPKLTTTVIVSPIDRATDEKTAHDLIDEHHEIRLQLDEKYNSQGFGVVLSKSDAMDPKSYLKHAADRPSLDPARKKQVEYERQADQTSALERDESDKKNTFQATERQVTQLEMKIKKARTRLGKTGSEAIEKRQNILQEIECIQEKRESLSKSLKAQKSLVDEAEKLNNRQQRVSQEIYSQLTDLCITARSNFVVERLRQDISERVSQTRMKSEASGQEHVDQIQVIATSSTAYTYLCANFKPLGFPNKETTGVPQVRRWLSSSALNEREGLIDMALNQYSCLLRRIHERSAESDQDRHQNSFTAKDLDEALVKVHQEFNQTWRLHMTEIAIEIHAINPLTGKTGVIAKNLRKLPQIASDWSLKYPEDETSSQMMIWGTYGAILMRHGGEYKSSNGTRYAWLDKLTAPLLEGLVQDWTLNIHQKIPNLSVRLLSHFRTCWESYMKSIRFCLKDLSPALVSLFEHQEHALVGVGNKMQFRIRRTLKGLQKSAAMAHPRFRTSLRDSLAPIFREACNIRGKGSYEARRNFVREKVVANGRAMLDGAFDEVKKQLDKNKTDALKLLGHVAEDAISDFRKMLKRMIRSNKNREGTDPDFHRHLSACLADIRHLSTQWQTEWAKPFPDPVSEDTLSSEMDDDAEMAEEPEDSGSEPEVDSSSSMATDQNAVNTRKRRYSEVQIKMEVD